MRYLEGLGIFSGKKPEITISKFLQIVPTIRVPRATDFMELMVEIFYEEGINREGFEYKSVSMFCPLGCGFNGFGMSLTSKEYAFNDSANKMGIHLRHDHQHNISDYIVENFYKPQIYSLIVHLPK